MVPNDDNHPGSDVKTLIDIPVTAADTPGCDPEQGPPPILANLGAGHEPRRFSDTFHVGRGRECELRVEADGVSRNHCEVFLDGGSWGVRDQGSTNGTWLDGLRVESAPLQTRSFSASTSSPLWKPPSREPTNNRPASPGQGTTSLHAPESPDSNPSANSALSPRAGPM